MLVGLHAKWAFPASPIFACVLSSRANAFSQLTASFSKSVSMHASVTSQGQEADFYSSDGHGNFWGADEQVGYIVFVGSLLGNRCTCDVFETDNAFLVGIYSRIRQDTPGYVGI